MRYNISFKHHNSAVQFVKNSYVELLKRMNKQQDSFLSLPPAAKKKKE